MYLAPPYSTEDFRERVITRIPGVAPRINTNWTLNIGGYLNPKFQCGGAAVYLAPPFWTKDIGQRVSTRILEMSPRINTNWTLNFGISLDSNLQSGGASFMDINYC